MKRVSIQPLLLFICISERRCKNHYCFNTTLVTVYRLQCPIRFFHFRCFNTTLVTVYRDFSIMLGMLGQFQYNPCYCLSVSIHFNSGRNDQFQYNPCYCLSHLYRYCVLSRLRFNTTLVTVYLESALNNCTVDTRFNTTLVTVYPAQHHLFAPDGKFQYNPCYCLSKQRSAISSLLWSFNTTLVTVYHNRESVTSILDMFQYNPCYCLSSFSESQHQ